MAPWALLAVAMAPQCARSEREFRRARQHDAGRGRSRNDRGVHRLDRRINAQRRAAGRGLAQHLPDSRSALEHHSVRWIPADGKNDASNNDLDRARAGIGGAFNRMRGALHPARTLRSADPFEHPATHDLRRCDQCGNGEGGGRRDAAAAFPPSRAPLRARNR